MAPKYFALAFVLGSALGLAGARPLQAAPVKGQAAPEQQWTEEVLMQLSELRKSQGDLTRQVAALRAEVDALKSTGEGAAGAPGNVSIDLRKGNFPSLGDDGAEVAIVEFSDFECPFCRRHKQQTLAGLTGKYVTTGKVRYYFVDFPLSFHARAMGASMAGACADQQGAFWKMHDALFENQKSLGDELYLKLADELSLDRLKFQKCLADPKVKQSMSERLALGERVGVTGTPAFLVGRIKDGVLTNTLPINGARPAADFDRVLARFLAGS
jgi:protein-disulfide isomerase